MNIRPRKKHCIYCGVRLSSQNFTGACHVHKHLLEHDPQHRPDVTK